MVHFLFLVLTICLILTVTIHLLLTVPFVENGHLLYTLLENGYLLYTLLEIHSSLGMGTSYIQLGVVVKYYFWLNTILFNKLLTKKSPQMR